MQKVIYIKDYNNRKKGDVEIISNNIAHGLIESGIVQLYNINKTSIPKIFKAPENKMMEPEIRAEGRIRLRRERKVQESKKKYQIK